MTPVPNTRTGISGPKQVTEPTEDAFDIEQLRDHLRIQPYEEASDGGTHPDDAIIQTYLGVAREMAEDFTGLAYAPREFEIALDTLPEAGEPLELPMSPVSAILAFTTDTGGSDQADVDPTLYQLDNHALPSRLLAPDGAWPSVSGAANGVVIRYLAGYGAGTDAYADLPKAARGAILLALATLYENRGQLNELPAAAQALLRPKRVRLGMA